MVPWGVKEGRGLSEVQHMGPDRKGTVVDRIIECEAAPDKPVMLISNRRLLPDLLESLWYVMTGIFWLLLPVALLIFPGLSFGGPTYDTGSGAQTAMGYASVDFWKSLRIFFAFLAYKLLFLAATMKALALAMKRRHAVVWKPGVQELLVNTFRFGFPAERYQIRRTRVKSLRVLYRHCEGCGEIFVRSLGRDPYLALITLILKDNREISCGEYRLKPVRDCLFLLRYLRLLEQCELIEDHERAGYCKNCMAKGAPQYHLKDTTSEQDGVRYT